MWILFHIICTILLFCISEAYDFVKTSKLRSHLLGFMMGFSVQVSVHADMLTFPLKAALKNNIILMRAGECYSDANGKIETNPVKKLAIANGLTEKGRLQVVNAAKDIKAMDWQPTYIWTSNTERAYESAVVLARELELGQNRIVPEYSFLDARSTGVYEGQDIDASWEVIHQEDKKDIKSRPPSNNDGTPSESVSDVLVRMNQVMSTIDAMYSGENVVIVAPDSEILQSLQAAVADENPDTSLPLHQRFSMRYGEVRQLSPLVKIPTTLASGQTQEEANTISRRVKSSLVGGSIHRDDLRITKGGSTWLDLLKIAL